MLVSSIQGAETAQISAKPASELQKSAASDSIKPFYFSPSLVIDPKSGTDVLEYLNTSTGAVINQYPSEKDIKAYSQTSAATETVAATVAAQPAQQSGTSVTSAKVTDDTTVDASKAATSTAVIV